jgi:hypothetical protein
MFYRYLFNVKMAITMVSSYNKTANIISKV